MTRRRALLGAALASDAVKTRFAALGVAPVILNRADTVKFIKSEGERYAAVIKARGIKVEIGCKQLYHDREEVTCHLRRLDTKKPRGSKACSR